MFRLMLVGVFVGPRANILYEFQLLVFQQIEADEYMDAASHTPVVRFYGITEVSLYQFVFSNVTARMSSILRMY